MAKNRTEIVENRQEILNTVLEEVMHNSMIPYSENVILDRAIPRVEDGLKPVQRRVLYSMHEMGLTPDKPHKKCARIVGDCLGKYHPHGDSSVYGALVRLAQTFSMRMPLVDGHGNFGSVDGDDAAAMRYTEARMNPLALELLRDIDKETVQWTANFDDSLEEPMTLPGRFPNLLVNGANGIAVGLATNIPTHNMGECIDAVVMRIENPKATIKDLFTVFHGPDFPTGGYIIPVDSLESIYETGKGRIKIRSRVHVEPDDGGKKNIIISEIPYQVNKSDLLTRIADLKEANKETLQGIVDIVDESDKKGMRAVIKLRKDADANKILDFLMKKSNLEIGYSVNMVAIANGKPEQLSLTAYLDYYIEYQREVIVRRTNYDLKAAKMRAEIVEGLLVAIRNIDEVIKIIKESETTAKAKERLMSRFSLSDVQAQAILDMRLKSLARLEVGKLEQELRELKQRIAEYEAILASKHRQLTVVKKELLELKRNQDVKRATVIVGEEDELDFSSEPEEPVKAYREGVLAMSADGQLRFMSPKSYYAALKDVGAIGADSLPKQALAVNNRGALVAITNLGSLVKLDVTDFPEKKFKEKGFKINTLSPDVQSGEYPVSLIFFEGAIMGELVLFTRGGYVKRVELSEFTSMNKAYIKAINLADKDEVISAEVVDDEKQVMEVTSQGQILIYRGTEIPLQGRNAAGVKGVKLNDGDSVVFGGQADDEGEIVVITKATNMKRVITATIEPTSRYLKGVKLIELEGDNRVVFIDTVKMPYDIQIVTNGGTQTVNTEQIKLETRTTKGKQLVKGAKVEFATHIYTLNQ